MALFNKAVDRVSDGLEGCSSSQLPALRTLQAMMPRVEALIAALERAATPTQVEKVVKVVSRVESFKGGAEGWGERA